MPWDTPWNGTIPDRVRSGVCGGPSTKRNGVFRSDWSRGLVVAAVNGIEICSSFARFCDHCMERKVQHVVAGELREDTPVSRRCFVP